MQTIRVTKAAAFTLVELLVVIAIIAVLISILLPSLNKVRRAGNNVACQSNLRQIGIFMNIYANGNKGYLPVQWNTDDATNWCNASADNTTGNYKYTWYGQLELSRLFTYDNKVWVCPETTRNSGAPNAARLTYSMNGLANGKRLASARPSAERILVQEYAGSNQGTTSNNSRIMPGYAGKPPSASHVRVNPTHEQAAQRHGNQRDPFWYRKANYLWADGHVSDMTYLQAAAIDNTSLTLANPMAATFTDAGSGSWYDFDGRRAVRVIRWP